MNVDLWLAFKTAYMAWSAGQKADIGFGSRQALWERYTAARDAYISRPAQHFYY